MVNNVIGGCEGSLLEDIVLSAARPYPLVSNGWALIPMNLTSCSAHHAGRVVMGSSSLSILVFSETYICGWHLKDCHAQFEYVAEVETISYNDFTAWRSVGNHVQ